MTNSYQPTPFRVALIQFTALRDPEANIGPVSALIRSARAGGAQITQPTTYNQQ